jgi:HAMP domain-containing protein
MGLRLKFNIVLALVFAAGMAVSAWVSHELLQRNAKHEVLSNAGLMMEAALAVRGYTVQQVKPLIEYQLAEKFLPQSVPAYAASETFNTLRKKYPDFTYKEALLNPTNPRNKAVVGERDTPVGKMLYIARPIQIKDAACLACHSVPAAAPASMIKLYGESNGFGWKHQEIVGAQVVSVPMTLPIKNANQAFVTFMGSLTAIFVVTFIVLNIMLSVMIIRPIRRMSKSADKISQGDFNVPEFGKGSDEVAALGTSFNRMRRSLQKALKLIEK